MTDTPISPCTTTPIKTEIQISPRISHALHQLAGSWSEHIAELFPFPHSDFLNRSSMWMHVAGLILANPISADRNVRVVFDHYNDWRDAAFVGSPRFTADNVCVLKKLTLPLWSREDYRLFTPLLDCPRAVKLMKHAEQITPELVRMIAHLPYQFRHAKIIETLMHPDESKLLFRLFNDRGENDKKRIVSSLSAAKSRISFWRKSSRHFFEQFEEFQHIVEIDDERFESVRTVTRLLEIGKMYENCASNYVMECITGHTGFFVFKGSETAIISYLPRIGNRYVIEEIKGIHNEPVFDETLDEIHSVLKNYGFHFGDCDPLDSFRSFDTRIYRLAVSGHEVESTVMTKKLGELLDQIDAFNGPP